MNMTTQEKRNITSGIMLIIGLLIMAVTALMPLLNINPQWMKWMRWIYTAGTVMVLAARIVGAYNGPSLRIKRLHRILISSGILYCASALMMFISNGTNDWIGFLLAGVMVQLYASWMIEREEKKTEK